MRMNSARPARKMAGAILGLALILPAAAQACPAIGSSWVEGDCSPRSTNCQKIVVTGHGWLSGRKAYKFDSYILWPSGWTYRYSGKAICSW